MTWRFWHWQDILKARVAGDIVSNQTNIPVKIGGKKSNMWDINDTNITYVTTPSACPLLQNCGDIQGRLCMHIHPTNYVHSFRPD